MRGRLREDVVRGLVEQHVLHVNLLRWTSPYSGEMPASALVLALAVLAWAAPASAAVEARDYVLGDITLPDRSPFGPLPVRMQGAIALPEGQGPHPLVVVVHGRHL